MLEGRGREGYMWGGGKGDRFDRYEDGGRGRKGVERRGWREGGGEERGGKGGRGVLQYRGSGLRKNPDILD